MGLRRELNDRDLAVISQVVELRLMTTLQVRAIHFPVGDHDNEPSAARACQRTLSRLVGERLLMRLERRVGGVRAGSASYVHALGPVGQRLLRLDGPRRRFYEPTLRFVDHTLAIAQLVVDLTLAARAGMVDTVVHEAEPTCHREYPGISGRAILRPDLFVLLGVGEWELPWFVEVDLGSESLPVVIRKCRSYEAYYQTGKEQIAHGVFPRVCWIVPSERRAEQVRQAIAGDRHLTGALFAVTTDEHALRTLGEVRHDAA